VDLSPLVKKLDAVRRGRPAAFGADAHKFRVLAPVSESAVAAFEAKHHVVLPPEYRTFITRVSAGGAGPAYGLIPFEDTTTSERDLPEDVVATPFPFTEAHNPCEDPTLADFRKREANGQLSEEDYSRQKASEVSGTLVLCHEGCGHLHLLVVNGAAYGQMWIDGTVSDGGYAPIGVGFLEWYERWLDSLLSGGDGVWWAQGSPEAESRR
jgi:SMI1 / KNR4 family (SUKH-1)